MSHLCQVTGSPVWLEERSACLCLLARISSYFLCQLPKTELKQTTELSSRWGGKQAEIFPVTGAHDALAHPCVSTIKRCIPVPTITSTM